MRVQNFNFDWKNLDFYISRSTFHSLEFRLKSENLKKLAFPVKMK